MRVGAHCASRIQGKREYQQDDYGIFELPASLQSGDLLLVLADGMGGERAGDRASATAIRCFIDAYGAISARNIPERLRRALDHANRELALEIAAAPSLLNGMGCTLLAAVLAKEGLYWISVGDSPLWLYRHKQLTRLNQDHSYRPVLAQQLAGGEISATDAQAHPDRNALFSALTGELIHQVDITQEPYPLQVGDRVLLASDGLLTLSEANIAIQMNAHAAGNMICQRLLEAVMNAADPEQDNTTVMVACLSPKHQSPFTVLVVVLGLVTVLAASWWWRESIPSLYQQFADKLAKLVTYPEQSP
ncbi:MAG: protein phosphatase 2C domain-containing protein [Candidatus Competibacteraceae bacterium]|jgi:protein phosphatase|nr:protein phosphatase 2C domain-containing protein [Candidatus Competibacteraceae bacterium]